MWMKIKNGLQSGDKDELIEVEEMELGNSDVEERGEHIGNSKDISSTTSIKKFAMHLNLHGFRYCFDNKIYRRIIWIILLMISMGFFLYFFCTSIRIYLTYPFYTVSTKKYIESLEYPAITICNRNDLRSSIINGTKVDFAIKNHVFNFTSIGLSGEEFADTVLSASHRIEDMLYSCRVGWPERCKSSDFTAVHLKTGFKCFTLNSGERGKLKLPAVSKISIKVPLTMVINVEHHDYFADIDHVGIDLIIHGADVIPSQMQRHLIAPGFFTHVDIKKHQIKHLPSPYYTKCAMKNLKYFKKYNLNHCYVELLTDEVIKRCGCRDIFMPGDAKVCSLQESNSCMWFQWLKFDKNFKQSSCPTPCVTDTYSSTVSFAMFPSNTVTDQMSVSLNRTNGTVQERRQFIRENFLKLTISYSDLSYELTEEVPYYNVVDILGTIGGLMALMLGASILTCAELIGFISSMLFSKCQRK